MNVRELRRSWWLTWRITKLNLKARLDYRVEFLMTLAVGIVWQASTLVFATVLLVRFPGIGGWSSADVLLMASMRLLSHGLYTVLLGSLIWATADGYLDAFLLRPLPVFRQVRLAMLNSIVFGELLVAVSLFGAALWFIDVDWTPLRIGYLVAALAGGVFMEGAIKTALSGLAMHSPATLHWSGWVDELMAMFGSYPLHILPGLARDAFTFVLPLGFIAYLPAAVLTGNLETVAVPEWVAVAAPLFGLIAFLVARRFWTFSLGYYKGVGGT